MVNPRATTRLTATLGALALALALTGLAAAKLQSTRLDRGLCQTTGGGRIVDIPRFPGEMIDRRLLTDIRMLEQRYSIFVTDGYSTSDVHAANGEHPLGLALDIVPNRAAGGRWSDIDRLAAWAEPRRDRPRAPFRWVGYDGDAGHGRGHHLHLSWSHSAASPDRTARTVFTVRCPAPAGPAPGAAPPPEPPTGGAEAGPIETDGRDGRGDGRRGGGRGHRGGGGHLSSGSGGAGSVHFGHGLGSGGIGARLRVAPPIVETDGADPTPR